MPHPLRAQIIDALWPAGMKSRSNCFVILDAARDDRIFGAVDRTSQDKSCLYSGDLPWQLQMAAPYLVQLDRDDRFTDYLIDQGWGKVIGGGRGDRRRAQRGQRDTVNERDRAERCGIHQQINALNPLLADCGVVGRHGRNLDSDEIGRLAGHEQ